MLDGKGVSFCGQCLSIKSLMRRNWTCKSIANPMLSNCGCDTSIFTLWQSSSPQY
jgi:hypothetical protein